MTKSTQSFGNKVKAGTAGTKALETAINLACFRNNNNKKGQYD